MWVALLGSLSLISILSSYWLVYPGRQKVSGKAEGFHHYIEDRSKSDFDLYCADGYGNEGHVNESDVELLDPFVVAAFGGFLGAELQ